MDKQQIIEAIEQMNVLELADLVKALEEKFGVSAAAAVVAAGPAAGPAVFLPRRHFEGEKPGLRQRPDL